MTLEIVYLTTGDDWLASYGEQLSTLAPSVTVIETGSPAREVDDALRRAEVLIADAALITRDLLEQTGPLRLLQITSTEYEDLPFAALEERGIAVAGVNEAAAGSAASHVLDLVIATARLLGHPGMAGVPSYPEIAGKTVGVVGLGYTGLELVRQLQGLHCEFRFADVRTPVQGVAGETGARRLTLDRVLVESDYVIVLVPLTPQTRALFDTREFRIMKPEAILINASDPLVIDAASMLGALDDGLFTGAGITYRDEVLEAHQKVVALGYPDILRGDGAEKAVGIIVDNVNSLAGGNPPRSLVESITFPVAGDPSFWSSRLAPRR